MYFAGRHMDHCLARFSCRARYVRKHVIFAWSNWISFKGVLCRDSRHLWSKIADAQFICKIMVAWVSEAHVGLQCQKEAVTNMLTPAFSSGIMWWITGHQVLWSYVAIWKPLFSGYMLEEATLAALPLDSLGHMWLKDKIWDSSHVHW